MSIMSMEIYYNTSGSGTGEDSTVWLEACGQAGGQTKQPYAKKEKA